MSKQPILCASCTSFSVDSPMLSSSAKKPIWLDEKDFVEEFIESQKVFKERRQRNCDQYIEVHLGKKSAHRYVLYWVCIYFQRSMFLILTMSLSLFLKVQKCQ